MSSPLLVYKIVNDINDKVYVGLTSTTLKERFRWHLRDARAGKQKKLYIAMRKLGLSRFRCELLEECVNVETLRKREEYYIAVYDSYHKGYNGSPRSYGIRYHSPDAREKMRQAKLGKKHTLAHNERIRKGMNRTIITGYVPKVPNNKGRKQRREVIEERRRRLSKTWLVTFPDGHTEKITNLRYFCDVHGLRYGYMWSVAVGKHSSHNGYGVINANPRRYKT